MTDTTEPETEVELLPENEATEAQDDAEPETEADESEADSVEEELVELEINGKLRKIPADLVDEFMLRPDYTRKTQEVAAQRMALEARITEATQASDDELNARATIVAIDAALAQYESVDWDVLEMQSPAEAHRHFRQFTLLRQQRDGAEQELTGATQRREAEAQRMTAERFEQSMGELRTAIPNWGEATAATLSDFAQKQFGFTDQEFRGALSDPRSIKMLHAAYLALKPSNKPKAPPLQPAAKVKGGIVPRKPLDDRTSTDDWMRQRQAEIAKRR